MCHCINKTQLYIVQWNRHKGAGYLPTIDDVWEKAKIVHDDLKDIAENG